MVDASSDEEEGGVSYGLRWYHWTIVLFLVAARAVGPNFQLDPISLVVAFVIYTAVVWILTVGVRWVRRFVNRG